MKSSLDKVAHLLVDWGSSNCRVFAVNTEGVVQDTYEEALGLLQVQAGGFAQALEGVLARELPGYRELPIYMAGMVGSVTGWVNVDYVPTPVACSGLSSKAHRFMSPWGAEVVIVPGVSHCRDKEYDVMRGEEVQAIGLAQLTQAASFTAIFPGTHSKHVDFSAGEIHQFSTYMTGELFNLLSCHSILGKSLTEQYQEGIAPAFICGVRDGQAGDLSRRLFLVRTHRLFNHVPENEVLDYLSGMLIGDELQRLTQRAVYLVGSRDLSQRYALACEVLGISAIEMSGDACFVAGMQPLIRGIACDE